MTASALRHARTNFSRAYLIELIEHGVEPTDFNSYGSRRGNDQVMTRGTFANVRVRNQLAPGTEGGWTTDFTDGQVKPR